MYGHNKSDMSVLTFQERHVKSDISSYSFEERHIFCDKSGETRIEYSVTYLVTLKC